MVRFYGIGAAGWQWEADRVWAQNSNAPAAPYPQSRERRSGGHGEESAFVMMPTQDSPQSGKFAR
jgi:hypothetical protein